MNHYQTLNDNQLQEIQGGIAPLAVGAIIIATPFVLGAIAGGADEYARKHGHH